MTTTAGSADRLSANRVITAGRLDEHVTTGEVPRS